MATILAWCEQHPVLEWLDLDVLGGNVAAQALYRNAGFEDLVAIRDMFRIDGEPIDRIVMTKRLRIC